MSLYDSKTLGDLKANGYISKSIKEEMRQNLLSMVKDGKSFAPSLIGYEDTVFPQIHHAILAYHDFILLGLRGQGKSMILKNLVNLLDEKIPMISGSPIHEDPLNPILISTKEKITELGDDLPISWLSREQRFSEKLATPDVSMSDLIGDIDPIKAANLGLELNNPDVIDFGLIPKANRCIFAINELADLQPRIQVGLFNIMEEKNIQIKGFPIQFDLDVALVYTANPEDYTARGTIITPLKDRINSQIITHYPLSRKIGMSITRQEVNDVYREYLNQIPEYLLELVEQIAIEARKSDVIDQSSGVSARLSISALENVIASAELRSVKHNEEFNIRISDVYAAVSAITGKIELLYEGEQEGVISIANHLIGKAILTMFDQYLKNFDSKNVEEEGPIDHIKNWFQTKKLSVDTNIKNSEYHEKLNSVKHLTELATSTFPKLKNEQLDTASHFIIEGLVMKNYLSKFTLNDRMHYSDMMDSLFQ